jgi:tRNA pseudouridine55 synthase
MLGDMVSGILNVDKPVGPTSFQVVGMVRRRSGVRRVGHAGTLDPMAGGVLLVCLGQAVRVSEYLMWLPKTYRATVRLGVSTTTYDAEGDVVREGDWSEVTHSVVEEALSGFVGEIMQAPPAYSAVKVEGERAYRRARRGEAVAVAPRKTEIYGIDLLRFEPPEVEIAAECGKGTYIRSLAHDLGEKLGCGAHLSALTRTRVGPFKVEDAVEMVELENAFDRGDWEEHLLPLDYALLDMPAITLHIEDEKDIRHGQAVGIDGDRTEAIAEVSDGMLCRAYAEDGSLVAIIRYDTGAGLWRARKVFATGG